MLHTSSFFCSGTDIFCFFCCSSYCYWLETNTQTRYLQSVLQVNFLNHSPHGQHSQQHFINLKHFRRKKGKYCLNVLLCFLCAISEASRILTGLCLVLLVVVLFICRAVEPYFVTRLPY